MEEERKEEGDKIKFNEKQILDDFEDVIELTWRKALLKVGPKHGLVDAKLKPVNEEASRIIEKAKKNHGERRKLSGLLGN